MTWLLLLSTIIYYSLETQAVEEVHAPPDFGSHLRHLEGADKNPEFLTLETQKLNASHTLLHVIPCWNASACAYAVYPVLGMVLGPFIPYIIGLVLAFGGLLITMFHAIFTDEAYEEFGLDKTFYRWAQIFLHYHCGLCSARWWPCLRQECPFWVKLVGFLGPSIILGLLLSPWAIGPAYTVSCGIKAIKYDSHDDYCYSYMYTMLGLTLVGGVFGTILGISCLNRSQGRPSIAVITPPESPRSQQ